MAFRGQKTNFNVSSICLQLSDYSTYPQPTIFSPVQIELTPNNVFS